MLVTFIGAPCSGKTTTAARLFADLKEQGLSVEFIGEYARLYIAKMRRLRGDDFKGLTDYDQLQIMCQESLSERYMSHDPASIVIADSCAISALLYMTDSYLEDKNLIESARQCAACYDLIFRCSPVRPGVIYDPNRLHSFEQSVEIDKRLDLVLDLARVARTKVHSLFGDSKFRVSEAAALVLRKVMDGFVKGS